MTSPSQFNTSHHKPESSAATIGVVMGPIATIKPDKDTTLGLLEAAQQRGWNLMYFEPNNLYLRDGSARGRGQSLSVMLDNTKWFQFSDDARDIALNTLPAILMRVDPPIDLEFLTTCHILQFASQDGVLVVNNPSSLHLVNEKIFAQKFPHLSPPTIISKNNSQLLEFVHEHKDVVLKPLNQMGGVGIVPIHATDPTLTEAISTATDHGKRTIVAQRIIQGYAQGDKRILLIDGKPIHKGLLRIPPPGQFCANLAAGGRGEGAELSERDLEICQCVGPVLAEMGLLFVGIDVIAGYLTEINVTSPTCMRELNDLYTMDIGNDVIAAIERKLIR